MTTDFIECPRRSDLLETLDVLRHAEDQDNRALYADWYAGRGTPPDWWLQAGSPPPPLPFQGSCWKAGKWVPSPSALPRRTVVMPLLDGDGDGAVVAVVRERSGRTFASRSSKALKPRDRLAARFRNAVDAADPEGDRFRSARGLDTAPGAGRR